MSEHVVVARLQYDDSGFVTGVTRDVELTRQMQAAMKEGAPAVQQLVASIQALGEKEKIEAAAAEASAKAKTAQINTTKAQSQAAAAAANATAAETRATAAETQAAKADEIATVKLSTAKSQLERATAQAAQAQAQLQATMQRNAAAAEETAAGVNSIGASLSSATNLVKAFLSAWVVRELWDETKKLVMEGVNFNSELEQTRIGSAAIITTFAKIYDVQGHLLTGAAAFNAAQKIGADLTDQIKTKTLETTLLFSQMQDATRRSLAYELQYLTDAKGVVASNKDLASFTSSFAQGGVTFGLSPDEIPNNLRALLTGRADPRHARFAAALLSEFGSNKEAREQMETWHEQGILIQELQKRLEAFAMAGKKSMDTYTGALSNLHDAWQQLLGEGTTGATKELTTDILNLRDSIVTVDKWGKATFNAELLKAIRDTADLLAKGATFTVTVVKKVVEPGGAKDFSDFFGEEMQSSVGDPVRAFFSNMQTGTQRFLNKVTNIHAYGMSRRGEESDKQLTYGYVQPGVQNDPFVVAGKYWSDKLFGDSGGWLNPDSPFTKSPTAAPGAPGTPYWARAVPNKYSEAIGPAAPYTLKSGHPEADDTKAENQLADFQRFMEPFHVGAAGGTDNDPLAKALQQITVERLQAIDHYKKAHKELSDANEDWKKDLKDIEATFTNRGNDAMAKYLTDISDVQKQLSKKYSPAKAGDYETSINAERQSALREIADDQKKSQLSEVIPFKGEEIAGKWEKVTDDAAEFFDKKLADAAGASITKINEKSVQATKQTVELEEQIRIDANTETENRRIDQITNSVDRELAVRIAANDRWAAEEDKRTQIDLAGDAMKELRETRLGVIEQARIQKNRAAEDAAFHARQAMIAGTDDWLTNLEKRRDEVIPKIGVTLQDTVIGALESTQSAIDKYFESIAASNANLGASADSLVHDLGQKWSKVFAEALSAPLHGGSILSSFGQIQAAFVNENGLDRRSLDGILAGAGVGSFIGGLFGPGNKAAAGGAIGGGVGSIAGGIIGSILPGIGTAIGAEIGSVIGGAIGSAIGATMKTSDHIAVSMRGLTLDDLRAPYTSTYGQDQTTQNLGQGSLNIEEKGISAEARADLITQVHRKAEETMKSWQQIIDLFPDEVKAKLASFHPTLYLNGGTGETGNITDDGALGSLNDFLSNKLPKATFAAYEPALRAGLAAMGEGQNRIEQLMTYWGTMQGTELHDAVFSYVSALAKFAAVKTKIGDIGNAHDLIPGSALAEARNNEASNALSQVTDIKGQMAGVLASLPKLSDVSDQLAAMEQLNTLSDSFFAGLVAGFQKIDELEKQTFASLDSFDEQVNLAGMGDQDKLDYYYKRMGELENQLQTTKDPERVSELVQQIEQYGQQALGLAPNNAQNRSELQQISAEVRNLAGADYNKGRDDLVAQQKSAYELLNSASQNLLKASNDLMGRGAGSGRGSTSPNNGGTPGNDLPDNRTPIVTPGPDDGYTGSQSLHDAFRLALDDKPIAIGTTSGVAMIVSSIEDLASGLGDGNADVHAFGVSPSIFDSSADWHRALMQRLIDQLAAMPSNRPTSSPDRSAEILASLKELTEEMRRTRVAIADHSVTMNGDVVEFFRSVGMTFQESVFQTLRDHPEMAVHLFDTVAR
jgi:hypothetical protein